MEFPAMAFCDDSVNQAAGSVQAGAVRAESSLAPSRHPSWESGPGSWASVQIIAGADQDRQAGDHHPLDESHLALRRPAEGIARRVVQEGFPEGVPDAHHIPASKGSVHVVGQLWNQAAPPPLAVGIFAEQRVAVGIQAEQVDRLIAPPVEL